MSAKRLAKPDPKDSRAENQQLTARDKKPEKSLPHVLKTTFSAPTTLNGTEARSAKSHMSGVPQNFNSFRHVITNATTGDDVKWIVQLRDLNVKPGKIE